MKERERKRCIRKRETEKERGREIVKEKCKKEEKREKKVYNEEWQR